MNLKKKYIALVLFSTFILLFIVPIFFISCGSPPHIRDQYGVVSDGQNLQLFNTGILGQPAETPVKLLQPCKAGDVRPENIMVDIREGKYFAATIRYPKDVTLEEARKSLNRIYKKYEKKSFSANTQMGLWRNEDDKFAIQLTKNEKCIQVIYHFRSIIVL